MLMSESDRVAIVTGASRGLGAVIAGVLAERRHDLVLGGRDVELLARRADALRDRGVRVASVVGDLATKSVRARFVDEAQRLGALRVLVNNASELGGIRPIADVDLTALERVMRVN